MNKAELVQVIAERSKLNKADATNALDAVIDALTDTFQKGESVTLVGFGQFQVKQREERSGRNPKTGESLVISASKTVSFKVGKSLKESLNS